LVHHVVKVPLGIDDSENPMAKKQSNLLVPTEGIEQSILLIRGQRVMLDSDLALLYGVETRALVQAVKRNRTRFPDDFMFQLTKQELENWRSQFVTSNPATKMGLRRPPNAFTEQGVAMLSSVLRSDRAVSVNIEIMRAFVRLRIILAFNDELARRLDEVEKHLGQHDRQFVEVIRVIRQLMESPPPPRQPRRRIGFDVPRDAAMNADPRAHRRRKPRAGVPISGRRGDLGGDKTAVYTARNAARHLQHRGGFARDILGVKDEEFAGVGRCAIDQRDDAMM
jgi:hypothetical protein